MALPSQPFNRHDHYLLHREKKHKDTIEKGGICFLRDFGWGEYLNSKGFKIYMIAPERPPDVAKMEKLQC